MKGNSTQLLVVDFPMELEMPSVYLMENGTESGYDLAKPMDRVKVFRFRCL